MCSATFPPSWWWSTWTAAAWTPGWGGPGSGSSGPSPSQSPGSTFSPCSGQWRQSMSWRQYCMSSISQECALLWHLCCDVHWRQLYVHESLGGCVALHFRLQLKKKTKSLEEMKVAEVAGALPWGVGPPPPAHLQWDLLSDHWLCDGKDLQELPPPGRCTTETRRMTPSSGFSVSGWRERQLIKYCQFYFMMY